jgi:hypothetical protein
MPILRVPVPENPAPEPVTCEGLRAMLETFVAELAVADDAEAGRAAPFGLDQSEVPWL